MKDGQSLNRMISGKRDVNVVRKGKGEQGRHKRGLEKMELIRGIERKRRRRRRRKGREGEAEENVNKEF